MRGKILNQLKIVLWEWGTSAVYKTKCFIVSRNIKAYYITLNDRFTGQNYREVHNDDKTVISHIYPHCNTNVAT